MKLKLFAVAIATVVAQPVLASSLTWADWTNADGTSASGTLGSGTVSFSGVISPAAQTNGGTNYWAVNSGIFTPTGTENPPPDSDIIRLIGGSGTGTQTITFSSAIVNPIMAIMSLGQPGVNVSYNFDQPFDILNQGAGYWGGNATALMELAGNVLSGNEGHGLIQFSGTFTELTWTVPNPENWHGFQIGYVDPDRPPVVPLPASLPLLVAGLGALVAMRGGARGTRKPA